MCPIKTSKRADDCPGLSSRQYVFGVPKRGSAIGHADSFALLAKNIDWWLPAPSGLDMSLDACPKKFGEQVRKGTRDDAWEGNWANLIQVGLHLNILDASLQE